MNQRLDNLSNNVEMFLSSNVIISCHYLANNFEDEFMSVAGDVGFNFSGQMSFVDTVSIMSDVGKISLNCVFSFEFYVIS